MTQSFGAVGLDAWMVMLSPGGEVVWQERFGGEGDDVARSVVTSGAEGFVTAGETYSFGAGSWDVWVYGVDGDGEIIWQRTYGREQEEKVGSIGRIAGGYLVAGHTASYDAEGGAEGWLFAIGPDGRVPWTCPAGLGEASWARMLPTDAKVGALSPASSGEMEIGKISIKSYDASYTVAPQCVKR